MIFAPLMWFALSEMDADDEEQEKDNDSCEDYWKESDGDSDGDDEY